MFPEQKHVITINTKETCQHFIKFDCTVKHLHLKMYFRTQIKALQFTTITTTSISKKIKLRAQNSMNKEKVLR